MINLNAITSSGGAFTSPPPCPPQPATPPAPWPPPLQPRPWSSVPWPPPWPSRVPRGRQSRCHRRGLGLQGRLLLLLGRLLLRRLDPEELLARNLAGSRRRGARADVHLLLLGLLLRLHAELHRLEGLLRRGLRLGLLPRLCGGLALGLVLSARLAAGLERRLALRLGGLEVAAHGRGERAARPPPGGRRLRA